MKKNERHNDFVNDDGNEIYIERIENNKEELHLPVSQQARLFFVLKGACFFSYERHLNAALLENHVIIVPPKSKCIIRSNKNVKILVIHLTVTLNFCEDFPFESLLNEQTEENQMIAKSKINILKIDNVIIEFLAHLCQCMNEGINKREFLQMKQKELLYYFGLLYTREELYYFFNPILNKDIAFARLIYKNFDKAQSLEDFSKIMNYSISGFKKRFMRVFGMPAYQWLCNEKAKRIFHAITCSRETFTQLSYEFGFSSPAHFNNFCKKKFNATPGEIRDKKAFEKNNCNMRIKN
jgi:AraC-like DNA-binding protein